MNYKIIVHQNPNNLGTEVIAVSSYAGHPVRGKAICAPDDEFDEEKGIALAKARCNAKIAEKRVKRALRKFAEAQQNCIEAKRYNEKMKNYLVDAEAALMSADQDVQHLLDIL